MCNVMLNLRIFPQVCVSPLIAQFMCLDTFIIISSTFHLQLELVLSWQEQVVKMPTQQCGTMKSAQNNWVHTSRNHSTM